MFSVFKLTGLSIYLLITLAFIPVSRKFKIRDQEAVHFITFTTIHWLDPLKRDTSCRCRYYKTSRRLSLQQCRQLCKTIRKFNGRDADLRNVSLMTGSNRLSRMCTTMDSQLTKISDPKYTESRRENYDEEITKQSSILSPQMMLTAHLLRT